MMTAVDKIANRRPQTSCERRSRVIGWPFWTTPTTSIRVTFSSTAASSRISTGWGSIPHKSVQLTLTTP